MAIFGELFISENGRVVTIVFILERMVFNFQSMDTISLDCKECTVNETDPNSNNLQSERQGTELEDENTLGGIHFYPPLYVQRYSFTAKILQKHNVKWVRA